MSDTNCNSKHTLGNAGAKKESAAYKRSVEADPPFALDVQRIGASWQEIGSAANASQEQCNSGRHGVKGKRIASGTA